MAKATTIKVKLNSTADTGFYYVTKKNSRTMTEKLTMRKGELQAMRPGGPNAFRSPSPDAGWPDGARHLRDHDWRQSPARPLDAVAGFRENSQSAYGPTPSVSVASQPSACGFSNTGRNERP